MIAACVPVHVCANVHVCLCMCKAEIDAECLPRSILTVFSEIRSVGDPGVHQMASLPG